MKRKAATIISCIVILVMVSFTIFYARSHITLHEPQDVSYFEPQPEEKQRDISISHELAKKKKEISEKYKDVPISELTQEEKMARDTEVNNIIRTADIQKWPLEKLNKILGKYGIYYVGPM